MDVVVAIVVVDAVELNVKDVSTLSCTRSNRVEVIDVVAENNPVKNKYSGFFSPSLTTGRVLVAYGLVIAACANTAAVVLAEENSMAVSYTHLTLPTTPYV